MSKVMYIEKDDCTSCALCTDTAPDYFRMDEDDIAETHNKGQNVQSAAVADAEIDKIQEIIDDCPAECIFWKE